MVQSIFNRGKELSLKERRTQLSIYGDGSTFSKCSVNFFLSLYLLYILRIAGLKSEQKKEL